MKRRCTGCGALEGNSPRGGRTRKGGEGREERGRGGVNLHSAVFSVLVTIPSGTYFRRDVSSMSGFASTVPGIGFSWRRAQECVLVHFAMFSSTFDAFVFAAVPPTQQVSGDI